MNFITFISLILNSLIRSVAPYVIQLALAFIFSGFHAGTIGAYLLSPYIMVAMTIDNDWRVLFYVYGTFGILLLIPWLLFAKDEPSTPVTVSASASNNDSDTTVAVSTSWDEALESYRNAPWKEFIQSKGVWGMLLAHCAKNWGLYTSLSWTPTFYAEQYNIGVRDSAWLSVMPSIAGALGGFIAGTLADKTIKNMSPSLNDDTTTQIRKMFQTVGLLGPAFALAALAYQLPEEAWVAQLYLMVAVGLQSFNAGGFEAGTQDKAGPRWIGMLYSVTSLPSVMGT
jgi:MFS transporter, ACS family, solute carrier family 17 (sodium-dependent inorganic phosphate cotransporter), other